MHQPKFKPQDNHQSDHDATQMHIAQTAEVLAKQQAYFIQEGIPPYEARVKRLTQLKRILIDHQDKLIEAISEDYHHDRPVMTTLAGDLMASILCINYTLRNLNQWMKPVSIRSDQNLPWIMSPPD